MLSFVTVNTMISVGGMYPLKITFDLFHTKPNTDDKFASVHESSLKLFGSSKNGILPILPLS